LTISINSVNKIAACKDLWDDFLPETHHLKKRHLLQLEKADIPNIETYYLQIFLEKKLIGLAYLQLFRFNHTHLNFSTPQTVQSWLIRFFLPRSLHLLVCGNLFRINFQGFYFKNEHHNAFIFEAIKLFTRQNRKLNPYGIIVKDCDDVFLDEKYSSSKYQFFNGDVTMEITRRQLWVSFDDYLNDLTKKYFKRAKKIIQAFEAVVIKELGAAEILENAADIERLYLNVVNKQKVRLGIINAVYLYELKLDLERDFELHAIYLNNTMIGFYSYIFYRNEMETHFIGLDYNYNNTHKTYFNILFLSVQKMIDRNYDKLELGRTAKEAKANLGAFPKQIFNYVKVNNALAKISLRHFLKKFNLAENQLQSERSPLK